jgi:hypothetical protein
MTDGGQETFPGRQWEERTPASQGLDPDALAAAIAGLEQRSGRDGVRELVIVRNGYLIWQGSEIDKVHGVWSCTKSVTSTILGLLDEPVRSRIAPDACCIRHSLGPFVAADASHNLIIEREETAA